MLFTYDIVLIEEIRVVFKSKLDQWRHILKSGGFRLSTSKIEYLKCEFNGVEGGDTEGCTVRYLSSII